MNNDQQRIFNIIAILTQRLGGEVTVTEAEIQAAPEGVVTINPDQTMTIKVEK